MAFISPALAVYSRGHRSRGLCPRGLGGARMPGRGVGESSNIDALCPLIMYVALLFSVLHNTYSLVSRKNDLVNSASLFLSVLRFIPNTLANQFLSSQCVMCLTFSFRSGCLFICPIRVSVADRYYGLKVVCVAGYFHDKGSAPM